MPSTINYAEATQRVALVDGTNFFVSCERVFRPDWVGRPVGVLSNNDGCIIARSNELKDAGIPMAAPYFKHKHTLEQLRAIIVSANFTLYSDMSQRMMQCLQRFTPSLEVYSIDEAWLDVTGMASGTLRDYGREIVDYTTQATGIPVAIGIAPTRTLAKLASHVCKQRRLHPAVCELVNTKEINYILSQTEVSDIWGVGRRLGRALKQQGIYTALQLRDACPHAMRARHSVYLQRIIMELRGVACREGEEATSRKQILASRSFGQKVTDKASLQEALATHMARAAQKLRAQASLAKGVQIQIRSSFHSKEALYRNAAFTELPVASADTCLLTRCAHQLLERIYQPGIRYSKAGVMLCDLCDEGSVQPSLFTKGDSAKSQALMQVIDQLNHTHGPRSIRFATTGSADAPWQMQRNHQSPHYTTQWSDIACAR